MFAVCEWEPSNNLHDLGHDFWVRSVPGMRYADRPQASPDGWLRSTTTVQ